jgi:hypothetical protein
VNWAGTRCGRVQGKAERLDMSNKDNRHFPTSYGTFCVKKLNHHKKSAITALNRFCARYRLARSLSGISLDTYSAKTTRTYTSMFSMFLAYTAYEALLPGARQLRVTGVEDIEQNVVLDSNLSTKLRANTKLQAFLLEHTRDPDLKRKLKGFYKGSYDDIVCVAYAVRNRFSHGGLLTTDIGSGLATDRKLLDAVATRLLSYCDDKFSSCVRKL